MGDLKCLLATVRTLKACNSNYPTGHYLSIKRGPSACMFLHNLQSSEEKSFTKDILSCCVHVCLVHILYASSFTWVNLCCSQTDIPTYTFALDIILSNRHSNVYICSFPLKSTFSTEFKGVLGLQLHPTFSKSGEFNTIRSVCSKCMLNLTCNFISKYCPMPL